MPSRLPFNSVPTRDFLSHFSCFMEASPEATLRATASMRAMASSAVEIMFPTGEFITMMPRFVAASRSTLSTPTPERPTTLKLVPASRTSAVIRLARRMRTAS